MPLINSVNYFGSGRHWRDRWDSAFRDKIVGRSGAGSMTCCRIPHSRLRRPSVRCEAWPFGQRVARGTGGNRSPVTCDSTLAEHSPSTPCVLVMLPQDSGACQKSASSSSRLVSTSRRRGSSRAHCRTKITRSPDRSPDQQIGSLDLQIIRSDHQITTSPDHQMTFGLQGELSVLARAEGGQYGAYRARRRAGRASRA